MSEQDPSEKFYQTEPKLPDLYVMWLQLAQIAHKLEPFARGDRTPAAVNQAREARENIRIARQELTETELFIAAQIRGVDDQREQALSDWESEVDRPDLQQPEPEMYLAQAGTPDWDTQRTELVDEMARQMNEPNAGTIPLDASKMPNLIQPTPEVKRDWEARQAGLVNPIAYRDSNGVPRASTDALVGHVRRMMDPGSPDCYNCGHPKGAHGGQLDPDIGPGCGTIVEHGYPCDCLQYAEGKARPVAEIAGQPASYGQLMEVCDDLELEDGTVRTEINQCASCGHGFQLHPTQGGQCTHTEIIGEPRMGEREHCLCMQYHPTYKFEYPGVAEVDPNQCEHCGHGRAEHKFQGCIHYDPQKGNCACLQYTTQEAQTP